MELRELRYFVTAAETGSLTAAAAELHMSQPPLSVAIQKLEAELGTQLLVRTSRGVEPTSAGRFLLDAASRVLGEVEDISLSLRRFTEGAAGALTMAAVPILMWHRIPRLLREHALRAPDVEVRLVDPPPWTAIDMLHQRKVDVAAVVVADGRRFAQRHSAALDITDWGDVPLVAALPPEWGDNAETVDLGAFDGQVVVLPRGTAAVPSLPEAVAAAFRQHGVVPREVRTVDTIQASIPLIEAGVARAILPDADGASLGRFDLAVRQLAPSVAPLRALVLTRPGAAGSNAALALLLNTVALVT